MSVLTETWNDLVTVGLLGTDRREPPELPAGPLADTVADALRPTPQGRLLAAVATTVVAQRCGATPQTAQPWLQAPEPDDRPLLPVEVVDRWQAIVTDWPVLEAEWIALATASGFRPAPDVLVGMLRRHQRTPLLAGAVLAWGGAPAEWLVDHVPDLAPLDGGRPRTATSELRPLPVPAEVEPLLHGDAATLATVLVEGLAAGRYRWSHRAVLLNVVARMDAAALATIIAALRCRRDVLDETGDDAAPLAMWESLIELATVRAAMVAELRGRGTP